MNLSIRLHGFCLKIICTIFIHVQKKTHKYFLRLNKLIQKGSGIAIYDEEHIKYADKYLIDAVGMTQIYMLYPTLVYNFDNMGCQQIRYNMSFYFDLLNEIIREISTNDFNRENFHTIYRHWNNAGSLQSFNKKIETTFGKDNNISILYDMFYKYLNMIDINVFCFCNGCKSTPEEGWGNINKKKYIVDNAKIGLNIILSCTSDGIARQLNGLYNEYGKFFIGFSGNINLFGNVIFHNIYDSGVIQELFVEEMKKIYGNSEKLFDLSHESEHSVLHDRIIKLDGLIVEFIKILYNNRYRYLSREDLKIFLKNAITAIVVSPRYFLYRLKNDTDLDTELKIKLIGLINSIRPSSDNGSILSARLCIINEDNYTVPVGEFRGIGTITPYVPYLKDGPNIIDHLSQILSKNKLDFEESRRTKEETMLRKKFVDDRAIHRIAEAALNHAVVRELINKMYGEYYMEKKIKSDIEEHIRESGSNIVSEIYNKFSKNLETYLDNFNEDDCVYYNELLAEGLSDYNILELVLADNKFFAWAFEDDESGYYSESGYHSS